MFALPSLIRATVQLFNRPLIMIIQADLRQLLAVKNLIQVVRVGPVFGLAQTLQLSWPSKPYTVVIAR